MVSLWESFLFIDKTGSILSVLEIYFFFLKKNKTPDFKGVWVTNAKKEGFETSLV